MSRPRGYDRLMISIELASNVKFARLTDAQKLCVLLGVWPLAAKADPRGYLVVAGEAGTAADVAHHARCSPAIARSTLARMRELLMLEAHGNGYEYVHDWHEFNPDPRPSDSREAWRERKQAQRQRHANVTRDTAVTSRDCHATEVEVEDEGEVEEHQEAEALPLLPQEARPKAALSGEQVHDLFDHWRCRCRPRSQVVLTQRRQTNVRSRASRDGFAVDQLRTAIDGAARAIQADVLDYEHQETEFARIFVDEEHVDAWIAYAHDGDDDALSQSLWSAEDANRRVA